MGVTKNELLANMEQGLRDMALGDIKRACKPGNANDGAKMAGFLLGFCFIDAAAGFYAGRTRQSARQRGVIGNNFRAFVTAYMPRYDAGALYRDLRSGLVHSYSIGDTYAFTDLERAGSHFDTKMTGFGVRTLLNLEDFANDLEHAYQALREDIETDPDRLAKAKARYDSLGLMTVA
jgi:hypothetical protein